MHTCLKKLARRAAPVLTLFLFVVGAGRTHAQMVDLNGNGMSDIWELIYGAAGLDPNADTDGDGVSNRLEGIAATDPFDPTSFPQILGTSFSATNFNVTMLGALGKQYQLQSSLTPDGTNWATEASVILRTGATVTLSAALAPEMRFFRFSIADVDSDGDGVNDWEEYQLGLDPLNPFSNGQLDVNGHLIADYAYVTGKLASENVVTIVASYPSATEPDPGQPATATGTFTITRGGFPLNTVTVLLGLAGPGPGFATEFVDHAYLPRALVFPPGMSSQTVTLNPLANTNLMSPVIAQLMLQPGTGYKVGGAGNAGIVIYPSPTPNGGGLTGQYFTNSSATYTNSANFNPANLVLTRLDPAINFVWGTTSTPIINVGNYCVRWTGQVQPQYSETYTFDAKTDEGVKLWVNDQLIIDHWVTQSLADSIGSISLQAGVRYDIRMEYFNHGGAAQAHLSWYSPSQSEQIIPAGRLYPATVAPAPAAIISPLTAVAFLGQPFSNAVVGANSPRLYTASPLPPGLGFNPTNGVISGTPLVAGDYQITITAANSIGTGTSVLDLTVIATPSSVTREVWLNVPGTNVSDIPSLTPATVTNMLGTLEGITDFGDNYGERIRGYLTAPATGNYYFWIAAGDSAELWISNDAEPANKVRRALVLPSANPAPPPGYGTASRQWNLQPGQRSPWLALVAGQRYYVEILHKAGVGAGDNFSVGWLQDPTGTNTAPDGVVPGYVLTPYFTPPPVSTPGVLYAANLLAPAGVLSDAVGSATMRVSADGSTVVLNYKVSGLSSLPPTSRLIWNDPYLNNPSEVLFDLDTFAVQPDGSYLMPIAAVGTLAPADILEIINEGKAFLNFTTTANPNGELSGHFTLANGTPNFTPPPPAPIWTDDHADPAAASRFLIQATFGPSSNEVASVQSLGYEGWINNQFALPASHHLPVVLAKVSADPTDPYPSTLTFNTWWQQSVTAPDQLRQRVAFALSEIMVISDNGVLQDNARALSAYYDLLLDNAFGNFRDLLNAATLSPAMGLYLSMLGNDKGSLVNGTHPNENYAREIEQLFSIGLNRMWPDGTLVMDSQGNLVPTYDQNVIMGFAALFTGWNYRQADQANGRLPSNWYPAADYINPMVLVPTHHELGAKLVLDNVVLPGASGSQTIAANTNYDNYGLQDLQAGLDSIFNHQNVGPFICRELIQRLVTSNPSRDYLYRVTQKFNDNGSGVRGDLQAVVKAILLDYEARSGGVPAGPTYGKLREPLLRATAPARAFPPSAALSGTYSESGDQRITITTAAPHRLASNDRVVLSFTDTSGLPAPSSQSYIVTDTNNPSTFIVTAPGLVSGSYIQGATNITIAVSGHGLTTNNFAYLAFTTGGAASGPCQVVRVVDSAHFTVTALDSAVRSGAVLLYKLPAAGYIQNKTIVSVSTTGSHGLLAGDSVWINFGSGNVPNGQYPVVTVPDPSHFTIISTNSSSQTQNSLSVYPLKAPPLIRSGTVVLQESSWIMGASDSDLSQTPLQSPTVFNFFLPGFQSPGPLAAAGLTTPEFQLVSDTSIGLQMNFFTSAFLTTANTNGITSFRDNGSVVMDLGPWITPNYTSNAGLPGLVDALNTLVLGGGLSTGAKTAIVLYVANASNFPYSAPPTDAQMLNRVRAVVHMILLSPDFNVQK